MTTGKTRDEIAEAYSSEPWWYDLRGFFILTFAYNSTIGTQMRFFGPNFGPDHLEVACGTGTLLEMILKWRRRRKLPESRVIGIDYAPSMLAGAKKRFAKDAHVHVQHADAADLPFPENTFDTANIANSIHCFPTVDGWAANNINDWGIRKGILYSPFEQAQIREKVLAAGYEIASEFTSGNTWNVVARKPLR
jgi:ubiquinone/menaquinone biosynthesis C-methylase UbiE